MYEYLTEAHEYTREEFWEYEDEDELFEEWDPPKPSAERSPVEWPTETCAYCTNTADFTVDGTALCSSHQRKAPHGLIGLRVLPGRWPQVDAYEPEF